MTRLLPPSVAFLLLTGISFAQQPPGTAEKIGEKIDRGLSQLGAELSQAWNEARQSIDKMGIQGRVYGRLHWDKALESAKLDIGVRDGAVVTLSGTVASIAAKQKAEQLARDTVGVSNVINDLAVSPAP